MYPNLNPEQMRQAADEILRAAVEYAVVAGRLRDTKAYREPSTDADVHNAYRDRRGAAAASNRLIDTVQHWMRLGIGTLGTLQGGNTHGTGQPEERRLIPTADEPADTYIGIEAGGAREGVEPRGAE
jgi:hypothetical protein